MSISVNFYIYKGSVDMAKRVPNEICDSLFIWLTWRNHLIVLGRNSLALVEGNSWIRKRGRNNTRPTRNKGLLSMKIVLNYRTGHWIRCRMGWEHVLAHFIKHYFVTWLSNWLEKGLSFHTYLWIKASAAKRTRIQMARNKWQSYMHHCWTSDKKWKESYSMVIVKTHSR